MAGITCRRGRNMGGRLARRPRSSTSMTGGTGTRRTTENARSVAGLTIDQPVRVVENIAGPVVIKTKVLRAIGLRLCESAAPLPEQESNSGQHDEKKTSKVGHRQGTSLNRLINFRSPA